MYEQDVKLARMLVDKIKAIKSEEGSVKEKLDTAREELGQVLKIREERDAYLAILSEAADLLDSKDLVVENPDTKDQQEQVDSLEYKLEELDEESSKYNRLIEALREKAPQLFEKVDESNPDAAPELSEEAREASSEETVASAETAEAETEEEEAEEAAPVTEAVIEDAATEEAESAEESTEEAEAAEPAAEIQAEEETPELAEPEEAVIEDSGTEDEAEEEAAAEDAAEPQTVEVHVGSNGHAGDAESVNGNGAHEAVAADEDGGEALSEPVAPAAAAVDADQPAPGVVEQVEATVVKVAVESPERTLSRFNLDHLKKKEAFTFGRGAAYIVDGDSVLDRLPYYDYSLRGVLEAQTRDELARDIDVLSTELHGKFHIVYSTQYKPSIQLGEHVTLNCAQGDGGKEAGDEHIRELVSELIARHTCVCVITGDVALADSVRGQSIHILQLHDFFRA
ncbi:MAG: hypothetical protein R3F46_15060 [bacterium]